MSHTEFAKRPTYVEDDDRGGSLSGGGVNAKVDVAQFAVAVTNDDEGTCGAMRCDGGGGDSWNVGPNLGFVENETDIALEARQKFLRTSRSRKNILKSLQQQE
ncbi:unnamed protein product [Ceratitis capitata]|uniref:(Mediterranean fruit fly) hypothetical protein n=1 Tax=Ceratitis capitata TaxID=7213 RepID=A0A811U2C8_CERCA|nr:unnamed protein product [Ceratitis capitata]